jgi:hypothetical protein
MTFGYEVSTDKELYAGTPNHFGHVNAAIRISPLFSEFPSYLPWLSAEGLSDSFPF